MVLGDGSLLKRRVVLLIGPPEMSANLDCVFNSQEAWIKSVRPVPPNLALQAWNRLSADRLLSSRGDEAGLPWTSYVKNSTSIQVTKAFWVR